MTEPMSPGGEEPQAPPPRDLAPQMRASDQERDDVVDQISEHAGQGRLTLAELEERIAAAHEATTRAQLAKLTEDLPAATPSAGASSPPERRRKVTKWIVAVMGGSTKKGRWRPDRTVNVLALMGGHDVDLREAELDHDEVTINVYSIMGGSGVYVPDTVDSTVSGFAIMGGNDESGSVARPRPGAPRVNVRMISFMGGSEVWRMPEQVHGLELNEAKKVAKRIAKGKL